MGIPVTTGLGLDDDEMQRRSRLQGQLGMSDSAVGPVIPPTQQPPPHPAQPRIASPSANDKTPPVTLRGISPQLQQRTSTDEAEAKRIQDTGSGISQIQHGSKEGGIGIAKPHPIWGAALRGLDVLGSAVAPGVMANIPGTELHHQMVGSNARARLGEDIGEQEKEAAVTKDLASANSNKQQDALARALLTKGYTLGQDANGNPELQEVPGFRATGTPDEQTFASLLKETNPETGKPYTPFEAYSAVKQAAQDVKPDPAQTQQQNKLAFQGVISKLDAAGLPSDPKSIDKSLDAALKKGVITQQEHSLARSYQSANPTPGTNLSVHISGQEEGNKLAINRLFEGKDVRVTLPNGSQQIMPYAEAQKRGYRPEDMAVVPAQESQKLREQSQTTTGTMHTFNRYQQNIHNLSPQLTEDDRRALEVLTSHEQVAQGFLAKATSGVLDTLFGEPLTGYSEKAMGGIMTKDQYDKLSPAGKQLLADYFNAVIQNFGNMKQILGSIGRNPMQLEAEINTIPLPYLDAQTADTMFRDKLEDIQIRNRSTPSFYGQASDVNQGQQNGSTGRRVIDLR